MSTLADELLQDFEGSESEAGDDHFNDDGFPRSGLDINTWPSGDTMDMDAADGNDSDSEAEDNGIQGPEETGLVSDEESPEEVKTRIEKIQFNGVRDIRTVASLSKTLDPVLEVSFFLPFSPSHLRGREVCLHLSP